TIELSATGMVTGEHLTLPTAGTITTGYGRNAAGEITSSTITHHTTPAVTHDRHTDTSAPAGLDHAGRLLAELTYTTNTRGHRATTAIDNLVRTIDIDTRGRITGDHTNLLDSTTTGGLVPVAGRDFTWQADSTLTAITDQLRGTTRFTVDAIGRATSATRTPHTNTSGQGTTPPHTTTHTPARAGTPAQSGTASGVSAQENYSFTPAGVLASTADGVIDYHNTLPVKVGRTTYTYDNAGRITRTVTKRLGKKPLVHHFYYATGEQPIGFTSSDEPTVGYRYTYDGLGRRVAKDTINTTTGEVIHRDVFTHTGNQLAAVTTTIDTTDPARVGEGYVWTTDPATGETHGQITLTTSSPGDSTDTPANPAAGWSQARVDATFYALVCDLAGAPQELINTTTGVVEGHTTQTLYGKRTWSGRCTSPLLFAGQYEDVESGWAYNRFRYYNPTLGAYNAQDPLGLAPRLASAQGYVDHAAYWVDVLGLMSHVRSPKDPHPTISGRSADGTFRGENGTAVNGRRAHSSYSDFIEAQGYKANVKMPGDTRMRPDAIKIDDSGYIREVRELKPDSATGQRQSVNQLAKYKEHAESFNRQNAAELGDSTVPDVIATADWYTP
ncbi:RHS repeat-associated core domain-containing protein, partial [Corynebacterium macclintockiae]|uniref:RHS repeat-associated core domain-containing protein n=1 Tax=Corynebacterium macclintockiae TaxID=2913501 RepID=UPI003EBA7A6A